MELLRTDTTFADTLADELRRFGRAFFWEHPPFTPVTASQDYECVLNPAAQLEMISPDAQAFAEHLQAAHSGIATFTNLGGDSMLVAPAEQAGVEAGTYAHIGAFLRGAPVEQQRAMFVAVGEAMRQRTTDAAARPVFLSTSGLGISWLHVRLDNRPKYYTFGPYKAMA